MESPQEQPTYMFLDISQNTNNLIGFRNSILQQGVFFVEAPAEN
jgi:hypothetical protein